MTDVDEDYIRYTVEADEIKNDRETKKAILIVVSDPRTDNPSELWMPKSQVSTEGIKVTAPEWLWVKKCKEKGMQLAGRGDEGEPAIIGPRSVF